jgi:hypothetical protein
MTDAKMDTGEIKVGQFKVFDMIMDAATPSTIPKIPPTTDSVTDSIRN